VLSVAFSTNGAVLVSAEGRERQLSVVRFRNVATGELLRVWDGHSDWPLWAEYSPDGVSVGSGSYGELLIRVATSGAVKKIFKPDRWSMTEFSFSPDGTAVAAGGWDHSTVRKEVPGGWEDIASGRLQIWETRSGESIANIAAHDRAVTAVKFSPSGCLLVTAGRDGTVKLWDFNKDFIERRPSKS
jgi:WD40 repeat protein